MFKPRSSAIERQLWREMLAQRDALEADHSRIVRANTDGSLNSDVSGNFKLRAALMWNLGLQCFVVAAAEATQHQPEASSLLAELVFRSRLRAIEPLYVRLAGEGAVWLKQAWRRRGITLTEGNPLHARYRLNELEGYATHEWQLRIHRTIMGPDALP